MVEENKNEQRFPEPTVGVLVYNDQGEILLINSNKWGDAWHIPGGHIEMGEESTETAKREIKEETGLDIDNVEFSGWQDAIYPKDFFKKKHFIFLDFFAKKSGGQETKSNEMEKWVWIDPKKALETLKINPYTTVTIKRFIEKQNQPAVNLKCEEYLNNWKRALADYKNLQTEIEKRRGEWIKMSEIMILEEFLPVYEHLKLAINNEKSTDSSSWLEGVKYVIKQFADILKTHGVEEIKTVGEKFDPMFHEAVSEESNEEFKPGVIIKEMQGGYKMGDKILQAAKVIVSKK